MAKSRCNHNYCCVEGCLMSTQKDSNLSFFTLPKDSERRNEWLKVIGRPDLLNKPDLKHRNYRVCSQHFENSMMSVEIKRKLIPTAIPTLHIIETESQPQQSTSKSEYLRKTSDASSQTTDSHIKKISLVKIKNASMTDDQTQTVTNIKEIQTQTSVALSSGTPRKRKLHSQLQESESKRKRLQNELDQKKIQLEASNSSSLAPSGADDAKISRNFSKLIGWQKSLKNKYKGNRYDPEFKLFALYLHFSSPQAYRSLSSLLKLPSKSTLSRLKLNIRPEIDERILNTISSKLQSLPDTAKYCTICVDEMVLKRHLYYDIKKDEIIGLHNINGKLVNEAASNAYVIMLRGIVVNWKQPVAYALLASTKHYEELDQWMNEVMSKLFGLGMKVMAIVSDQGSNFDRYAKEIKQVTIEKPYFEFNNNKIYYIFDVPHMVKCVRNNLLTNDFFYNGKKISWLFIDKLYKHQKEKNLRLIPKVTDVHIEPNNFQKMRVKYAAQIFSRSVYGALKTYIYAKILPEEATSTADFVISMNDLFDVLNSSKIKSNKRNQIAFSLNDNQIVVLDAAKKMFSEITAINRRTGTNNTNKIKTFKNIQITLQAIINLSKDLKKEGIHFICTRRLNQDPLENFFGAIRQHGGNCSEPTAIQFTRAFSKLFVTNMLKISPSSNCEGDICDLLLKGNIVLKETETVSSPSTLETSVTIALDGEKDYRFDLPTENALTYVAGYLLHKCIKKHTCTTFTEYFKKSPLPPVESNVYSHFKAYNKKTSFYGSLKVPPVDFINYVQELENAFINNFEKCILTKPANHLLQLFTNINFMTPCPCFPSQYLLKLYVRFRVFSTLKFNNRYFKDCKKNIRHYIKVKQL